MTTFSQLKSDIVSFSARTDITVQTPLFIRIAEAEIFRRVRLLEMETSDTLTFTAAANYELAVPDGFLGLKSMYVVGATDPRVVYMTPDSFNIEDNLPTDAFQNVEANFVYTIEEGKIKLKSVAGATEDLDVKTVYFARPTALSDDDVSNAISINHYDIYLYVSLKVLWDWVDEQPKTDKYEAKAAKVYEEIVEHENARRRPAGPLIRRAPNNRVV